MDAPHAQTSAAQAALFADLCDYTRLTEELGDAAAARMALELRRIAVGIARRHHGRVVQTLGDGVHLHFAKPADAVRASLALLCQIGACDLPRARVGVNAGPMVAAGGDYYGRAVNLAARIAAQAAPGEVLVGETVTQSCVADRVSFDSVGSVRLKGVAEPVALFRARQN
jgi:adenylate cyclase